MQHVQLYMTLVPVLSSVCVCVIWLCLISHELFWFNLIMYAHMHVYTYEVLIWWYLIGPSFCWWWSLLIDGFAWLCMLDHVCLCWFLCMLIHMAPMCLDTHLYVSRHTYIYIYIYIYIYSCTCHVWCAHVQSCCGCGFAAKCNLIAVDTVSPATAYGTFLCDFLVGPMTIMVGFWFECWCFCNFTLFLSLYLSTHLFLYLSISLSLSLSLHTYLHLSLTLCL